jgi:(hydroxyamino)benzene mutase
MNAKTSRQLALMGAVLVLLGLLTGLGGGLFANPRMGLSSHLAAMMGGTLLLALSACWHRVELSPRLDRAAFWLLIYGNVANWAATLLAAFWGGGGGMMPIAAAGRQGAEWQEGLISLLLISLSLAMVAGVALVIKGLLAGRKTG